MNFTMLELLSLSMPTYLDSKKAMMMMKVVNSEVEEEVAVDVVDAADSEVIDKKEEDTEKEVEEVVLETS